MSRLSEAIKWKQIPIPANAACGNINLTLGLIGEGKPVGLIVAGIHGDEGLWGSRAIHKFLEDTPAENLRGSLRVVPMANPLAMAADTRNAPLDMLDLNRVFPGDAEGSHTEQIAAALVTRVIEGADIVIDLHGGGSWSVNAFVFQFPGSEPLASAFDAPFLVSGPDRNITLTGYARSLGARVVAVEMGGRSEYEERWAERIAAGLSKALGVSSVLASPPLEEIAHKPIPVGSTTVLRPSRGGIFVPRIKASDIGTIIGKGTVLGYLHHPATMETLETFKAPFKETAVLLLRPGMTAIEGGAMAYVVAPLL